MVRGNTRLREDTGINEVGQKDPEKLYWERKLEVLVGGIYRTQVYDETFSRHTGKQSVFGYFIGAIPLCQSIIGS
jgi:hypothetical protein